MMNKLGAILLLLAGVTNATNDECTSALRLYENEPVSGTNAFAVSDFNDRNACGPNSHLEGVWYEIIGTGEEVTLNICTENDRILNVGVFSACNSQSCVGFPSRQLRPASCDKNEYLSYQFLAERDRSYRVHIRANVIDFADAALGAEFTVFYKTTGSPTPAPSRLPPPADSSNTPPPTKPPTTASWSLVPYQTSNFGKVSTCKASPPTKYRIESRMVEYDYSLSKSALAAAAVAVEIEESLHQILSEKLLTCVYQDATYSIVQLGIGIRDRVISKNCTASGGNPCSVVRGGMDMEVAFPKNSGRRLSDAVYRDLILIFRDTLKSLGGEFEGFVDPEDQDEDDGENDSISSIEDEEDNSSLFLGLGIAIGVVVLLILFYCIRRAMQDDNEKVVEGVQTQDEETTVSPPDSPAYEVDYGDVNDNHVSLFETVRLEGADHDFRSCGNPECKHCKPESKPVFVSARESYDPAVGERRTFFEQVKNLAYNDGWATFDT